jgi:transmembrane protein TMEM174 (potassium channel)
MPSAVRSLYNRIVGQNRDRLAALSDGVFAVAMTLLVLDLRAPAADAIHSEEALLYDLLAGQRLLDHRVHRARADQLGRRSAVVFPPLKL